MTARVSMLLKELASPDMLRFSLCNKMILAIWHMNRPLINDTIDFVLRRRAQDLPAPPRIGEAKIITQGSSDNYLAS
jgi:hypothetical protein